MTLWSAALFGHYKPKVDGWERRAKPGDIVAVRPYSEHGFWTPTERREFLIVTIAAFDLVQLGGLIEPEWDTNSYPVIPNDEIERLRRKREIIELHPSRYLKKRRFHITLDDLRDLKVDIDKMLNKDVEFTPDIDPINKKKVYDKLKGKYAQKSDGFNIIKPLLAGSIL